jgi:signal transduction histidine kinase
MAGHGDRRVAASALAWLLVAAYVTAMYVVLVLGVGDLVGVPEHPSIALSLGATALVAATLERARAVATGFANRVVLGSGSTAYELLAQFIGDVSAAYATDEVLTRMSRIVAEATHARFAEVWAEAGDTVVAASWPPDSAAGDPAPGSEHVVEVRQGGQRLGGIRTVLREGTGLHPLEETLLRDLAAQAGLVLRNVALSAELESRLQQTARQAEDLLTSCGRIVATEDAERQRLERNIHDGAQQHVVALAVQLQLVRRRLTKNPEGARELARRLAEDVARARTALDDLAGGLYPPELAEAGVVPALTAAFRRLPVPVLLTSNGGGGRWPTDVEGAVYFACLEAVQNALKYAGATRVEVHLRRDDRTVTFTVGDDGAGFDPSATDPGSGLQGMADRMAAVGGGIAVTSSPGSGTTVSGSAPLPLAVGPA